MTSTSSDVSGFKATRRGVLAIASAAALGACSDVVLAGPSGTRPTVLGISSVQSVNNSEMRVTGRLTDLLGRPLAGMKVDIYQVYEASFTRWITGYTDNNGNFSLRGYKVNIGARFQVVVDGNAAYSQPFPTFNRV